MSAQERKTSRNDRYHNLEEDKLGEHRSPAQRDRDRLLYTSAFRRLAEVTQVVAANNAHVFHNRLTHSLQVAQVGRRIAEIISRQQPDLAQRCGGVCPDVVEAACLAHDLGHPPFGHVAERELNDLAKQFDIPGGFEGNAQSFRIVTNLAFRSGIYPGLNLTHATLGGLLKYPWLRRADHKKWGAYPDEKKEFQWARLDIVAIRHQRTPEAEIMDWADDVTYSIHDMEDFYRAGRIPLHLLNDPHNDSERRRFFDEVFERRNKDAGVWRKYGRSELEQAFKVVVGLFEIQRPYSATKEDRGNLRRFTGHWIGQFINAIRLRNRVDHESFVEIDPMAEKQVLMLKELTWHYVINDPSMASQQYGQRLVIRTLFEKFYESSKGKKLNLNLFPTFYRERLAGGVAERGRVVIDLVSGMTERQAIAMYRRITGIRLGTAFDLILQ